MALQARLQGLKSTLPQRGKAVCVACFAVFLLCGCYPELDWRELSVSEGRFSALLPCKARREARTVNTSAGAPTMTMYACSLKRGTMAVAYTDYRAVALVDAHLPGQLESARDALLRNVGAGAYAEQEVAIAGLPGRQVYAQGRAGTLLKARFVVAGSRLYQIAYVGARDDLAMADIDMFLDSFKLLKVNRP